MLCCMYFQSNTDLNDEVWYQHAFINRLQTIVLLVAMAAFMALLGWLLWGGVGAVILLAGSLVMGLLNPGVSPRLVMRLYRARPLAVHEAPGLYGLLEALAARAGLPRVPTLYYVPSGIVNAFAVGAPDNAGIGVTDGLLQALDRRELGGVLAHEVSHIRSGDMRVMGLADLFSRVTSVLSFFGQLLLLINLPLILFFPVSINWLAIALLIFAPTLSTLAQLGLSRTREYDADLNAARLTGDPEGLARALMKIERVQGGWLERVFMPGRRLPEPSLLRTHPPTEERVRRLRELQGGERLMSPLEISFDGPGHLIRRERTRPPRWHIGSGLWR